MARTYDLKNVICTINGIGIGGYGEGDDALSFEWSADLCEKFVSADGQIVYARLNDRSLAVTVTVHQRSRSYALLSQLMETQHGDSLGIAPPQILPMGFQMIDPSNGDSLSSFDTVFMRRPAPSKGRSLGTVEFLLDLPSPLFVYGPANLLI